MFFVVLANIKLSDRAHIFHVTSNYDLWGLDMTSKTFLIIS